MASFRGPLVSAALLLAAAGSRAESLSVLPGVGVRLEAARYSPSDVAFRWDGWIGASASLLEAEGTALYFTGDVETIIGSERRAFDANQANYHLEAGLQRRLGDARLNVVFHHVSRHLVDRNKIDAVDWNQIGVRLGGALPRSLARGEFTLGVARVIKRSFADYGWEFQARAGADVAGNETRAAYALLDLRAVTEPATAANPRGGFLDARLEGGARIRGGKRDLRLFVAYEHRNDVFLFERDARDRALFGFRIALRDDESPRHWRE